MVFVCVSCPSESTTMHLPFPAASVSSHPRCVSASLLAAAAAIMSAEAVVGQIRGADAFFESCGHLPTAEKDRSKAAMCTSLLAQIRLLPSLSFAAASDINTALGISCFDNESKATLAAAIAQKTMESQQPAAASVSATRKVTQTLLAVTNYLTESDWRVLQDPGCVVWQKVHRVVERLTSLGLRNPSETTVRSVVACIACTHCHDGSGELLHSMVLDVKKAFAIHRCDRDLGRGSLQRFPDNPYELPADIRGRYAPGDQPVSKVVDMFTPMMHRVPMRTTNKALSKPSTSPPTVAPTVALGAAAPMHDFMQILGSLVQQVTGGSMPQQPAVLQGAAFQPSTIPLSLGQLPALEDQPMGSPRSASGQSGRQDADTPGKPTLALTDGSPGVASANIQSPEVASPSMQSPEVDSPSMQLANILSPVEPSMALPSIMSPAGEIARLERIGAGCKGTGDIAGDTATKKHGKVVGKVIKKPCCSKAPPSPTPAKGLKLGCGKCRGSHKGCTVCRDPSFGGKRWQC